MHHHDASGHSLANNCSAPSNTATAGRSQVPTRCASSPRPHGAAKLFGCTTVRTATGISSSSQFQSTRSIISSSSRDCNIHCFDVSTGRHSFNGPLTETGCIALASSGTFTAASTLSVSLWDTPTHKKIGRVIHHTAGITGISTATSSNYDFVAAGGKGSVRSQSSEFTHRSMHYEAGDDTEKQDETVSASSTALSLSSSTLHAVLVKWASTTLVRGSANEALSNAAKVRFT